MKCKKCGKTNVELYKCFYCKEYFCDDCAIEHFDKAIRHCSGYRVFPDGKKCEGCPDCADENTNIFKIGKYYKHNSGRVIFIGGVCDTYIYGRCLIGDDRTGSIVPVGRDEASFINWKEISKEDFLKDEKSEAGEKINGGSGFNSAQQPQQAMPE